MEIIFDKFWIEVKFRIRTYPNIGDRFIFIDQLINVIRRRDDI